MRPIASLTRASVDDAIRHVMKGSKMRTLDSYGKFLASADRQSWIDITRATSFNIEQKNVSENDVKTVLNLPIKGISAVWVVYCNYEKNSDPVGIFATEDEARKNTEEMLITAFGRSPSVSQASNSQTTGTPALLSPSPKAG